ncbi:MAG TPA: hypothetical protein VEA63_15385 [Opitutus sp.]|nr:hypothetical protein [Opitutus sp.]
MNAAKHPHFLPPWRDRLRPIRFASSAANADVVSARGERPLPGLRRRCIITLIGLILLFSFSAPPAAHAAEPVHEILLIVGAPGEGDYTEGFASAARAWEAAATRISAPITVIGLDETPSADAAVESDRDQLRAWCAAHETETRTPAWIVYLGHGTFDGREARLNLRGPDVTAKEIATWLAPLDRPLVFIHGGSAGAPFISALSGPDRIIISATRSGHELNYARFGERFAEAVANPSADIDQDGQTSLLEAFVTAAQQVQAFYAETGRLATEHALIDDNGDHQGTPADWFRGVRLQRRPEGNAIPDGDAAKLIALIPSDAERALTSTQREARHRLERELDGLRARKSELPADEYYRQLESLFRRLGSIYRTDS